MLPTDLECICARTHTHQLRIPCPSSGASCALRTAYRVAPDSCQPPQSRRPSRVIEDLLADHDAINTQVTTLRDSSMVRPRTCSETACTLICRRHRHEPNEDLTSRIHTIILHNLERVKDKDENKSRLRVKKIWSVRRRVRGWVFLGDRSQWRWGRGISNLAKFVIHCFIPIQDGLQLDS